MNFLGTKKLLLMVSHDLWVWNRKFVIHGIWNLGAWFLKSHHHALKAFWRTRERLLQDRLQRLVVALDFHVASVGVLVKFRKWEYNRKHFFLILCTSLLGLSECSACVRNQFGSLREGSSQAFLIGVTLDFKLALRVVIVNYWGGSHKTLHFSKRVLLLFHSVKLCVLLCEAAYRLHVVC